MLSRNATLAELDMEAARLGVKDINLSRSAVSTYWVCRVANETTSASLSHPLPSEALRTALLELETKEARR